MAAERSDALLATLPEREQFIRRGFDFQEAELAASRLNQSEKARGGNKAAQYELVKIKAHQKALAQRKAAALAVVRREPELIAAGGVTFVAHALIVPSTNPDDLDQHDAQVEKIAMDLARAYEEAAGAVVKDVHTPELARAAGLGDNPGFDLLSLRPGEHRAVEVKGRATTGMSKSHPTSGPRRATCATATGFMQHMTVRHPRPRWCECKTRLEAYSPRPKGAC